MGSGLIFPGLVYLREGHRLERPSYPEIDKTTVPEHPIRGEGCPYRRAEATFEPHCHVHVVCSSLKAAQKKLTDMVNGRGIAPSENGTGRVWRLRLVGSTPYLCQVRFECPATRCKAAAREKGV